MRARRLFYSLLLALLALIAFGFFLSLIFFGCGIWRIPC
jgi:hypothetical protein